MRFHAIGRALAAAALVALLPGSAVAFDWEGRIGLGYDRIESWSNESYSLVPRLRLDGSLGGAGHFVEPGVVDWAARVGYEDFRSKYGDTSANGNGLSYGATLGLLQSRTSRAGLSASANRSRSDFSTDLQAVRTTGATTFETYSVTGGAGLPGLPSLSSGFSYWNSVTSGLGRDELRETGKALDLGMLLGQRDLTSQLNYRMQWESGSLAPLNFTSQQVGVQAAMTPAEGVTGGLTAGYFLREPKELGGSNPKFENTFVNATLALGHPTQESNAGALYQYRHASATDPSLQVRELISNSAGVNYGRRISTDWRLNGTASGSFSESRLGDVRSPAAGESVGITADFTRPAIGASLGTRVGALEPEGGSTVLAYGASASGRANWNRTRHVFSLSYFATYDANLDATAGWTTSQSLLADVTGTVTQFMSWAARIQASAARGGGGAFGANAQRSIAVFGSLAYRHASLNVEVGTNDAVTGALSNPLSDGLFIPAGFNTHTRYAAATVAAPLAAHLTAQAFAKYAVLSGPATPDQRETLLGCALGYGVGYWTFSLDDRYTTGGTTSFDHRINELYFRASRSFGGR